MKLKRGNCYLADLDPQFGTEAGKVRPVILVQNDFLNEDHSSSLVCPITSKVRPEINLLRVHLKSKEAGLAKVSDIMIDQLRSVDNRRLIRWIGKISLEKLQEVEEKLKIILDLE